MSMEDSYNTIGNRTRDLPTCSAVPQPTAPPRTPSAFKGTKNLFTFRTGQYTKFMPTVIQVLIACLYSAGTCKIDWKRR